MNIINMIWNVITDVIADLYVIFVLQMKPKLNSVSAILIGSGVLFLFWVCARIYLANLKQNIERETYREVAMGRGGTIHLVGFALKAFVLLVSLLIGYIFLTQTGLL